MRLYWLCWRGLDFSCVLKVLRARRSAKCEARRGAARLVKASASASEVSVRSELSVGFALALGTLGIECVSRQEIDNWARSKHVPDTSPLRRLIRFCLLRPTRTTADYIQYYAYFELE